MSFKACAFNQQQVGYRRHVNSLLKISFPKLEKNSLKRIVNPCTKRYVNPFEIDESDIVLAAFEFLLTHSDYFDNKQDEFKILTV